MADQIVLDAGKLELILLRKLRESAGKMFEFTGWDQDCDDDAAMAARAVDTALRDLRDLDRILFNATKAVTPKAPEFIGFDDDP